MKKLVLLLLLAGCTSLNIGTVVTIYDANGKVLVRKPAVTSYEVGPRDLNGNRCVVIRRSWIVGGTDYYWMQPGQRLEVR